MSMLCTCIRGQMYNTFLFNRGANVHPCQSLGRQMSLHTIFHRGADVRGGKCPTLVNVTLLMFSTIQISVPFKNFRFVEKLFS